MECLEAGANAGANEVLNEENDDDEEGAEEDDEEEEDAWSELGCPPSQKSMVPLEKVCRSFSTSIHSTAACTSAKFLVIAARYCCWLFTQFVRLFLKRSIRVELSLRIDLTISGILSSYCSTIV
mmetsp:Transcript_37154/g.72979  ORF Transcript_37154/g.72979 Transcript_37154/m.72979 type:complete len:124 (-) Transcript_37154:2150-2521(-)